MWEQKVFYPIQFINNVLSVIEKVVHTVFLQIHPLFGFGGKMNPVLVVLSVAALFFYIKYKMKHNFKKKLKDPKNYGLLLIMLFAYVILNEIIIGLGGRLTFNIGIVAAPIVAKKLGPIVAGGFGALLYVFAYGLHPKEAFDMISLLLAVISGMIYGIFLYKHRTKYLRCLWSKLAVNVVCNILLLPVFRNGNYDIAQIEGIASNFVVNIALAPIQALIIYYGLILFKKSEKYMSKDLKIRRR